MNISAVKNVSRISVSKATVNANTAFTYGVRFFAYSYFYYFFGRTHLQGWGRASV